GERNGAPPRAVAEGCRETAQGCRRVASRGRVRLPRRGAWCGRRGGGAEAAGEGGRDAQARYARGEAADRGTGGGARRAARRGIGVFEGRSRLPAAASRA